MPNLVEVKYEQTGNSINEDALGMREMQARAYAARAYRGRGSIAPS